MSEEPVAPQRDLDPSAPHPPTVLQAPINVRSTSLAVLALIAVIGFLFGPGGIHSHHHRRAGELRADSCRRLVEEDSPAAEGLGAGLTLALILIGLGLGLESLQPQAIPVLDIVPRAPQKFGTALRRSALGPPGAVEKMQKAASEIEKAAHAASTPANSSGDRSGGESAGRLPMPPLSTSGNTS